MALSKPGVCSDPAPMCPFPAWLFKSLQSISPQPGKLPTGGDREHTGAMLALCLKCFSYGKPRSCLCFWQLPCPGSGNAESPAGTLPGRSQSPTLIH